MNQLHCARCGDVIGVYEPIRVFRSDDTMLEGSRLTLSEELHRAGSIASITGAAGRSLTSSRNSALVRSVAK